MTAPLLPHFVLEQLAHGTHHGTQTAVALMADLSGFSALTTALLTQHKAGAETLTTALNQRFAPLVQAVYAHGGLIATFAGDSFTALFLAEAAPTAALAHATAAAAQMQAFFATAGPLHTPLGDFPLELRVGLGQGVVEWGVLRAHTNTERLAYFFRGPALAACVAALQQAEVSPRPPITILSAPPPSHPPRFTATAAQLAPFFSPENFSLITHRQAEFRQVACVFVGFDPGLPAADLQALGAALLTLSDQYGGYFNGLDFADKGGVALVVFGAPQAHENDLARAADFLLALRQTPGLPAWRAGLTFGTAYTGAVGGAERYTYTAIGDVVNLAARLMVAAPPTAIWLDPTAASGLQARQYRCAPVGAFTFKGRNEAVAVMQLVAPPPSVTEATLYSHPLVGRASEVQRLTTFFQPIFTGQFAGVACIYGEAGMGKSRLAHELRLQLQATAPVGIQWCLCPTDEILRQPLNPFQRFLWHFFQQRVEETEPQRRAAFAHHWHRVLAQARATPRAHGLVQELERTRSLLMALVGLPEAEGLYATLDPRLRFENTLSALKALFLALSAHQPVVLQIEDVHWLDAESQQFLQFLTRNLTAWGVGVVMTSRYQDDGGWVTVPLAPAVPQLGIDLRELTEAGVGELAAAVLNRQAAAPTVPLSPALTAMLAARTNGNPFFVEQLALDWQERQAIHQHAGNWDLATDHAASVPVSISAVLVARLDRMPFPLKTVVQTAAVLGQEFEVQVLWHMLQHDPELPQKIKQAENAVVWSALTEARYLFKHALLREAAYDMQLTPRLRDLHAHAAAAITAVYAADLTAHAADLVYHYDQAAAPEQARHFAQVAGAAAAARYANAEAARHYTRALVGLPATAFAERYAVLADRERVYQLLGDRPAQQADLEALAPLAEALGDVEKQIQVALRRFGYAENTNDFAAAVAAARQALTLAQAQQWPQWEQHGRLALALAYIRQADYAAAETQIQQVLAAAPTDPEITATAHYRWGLIERSRGNHMAEKQHYETSLPLFRTLPDRNGLAQCLGGLVMVLVRSARDLPMATQYQAEVLALHRALGDRNGLAADLNALGYLHMSSGELPTAAQTLSESLELFRELGNQWGVGSSLNLLGFLAILQHDYPLAQTRLRASLSICEAINDRWGVTVCQHGLGLAALEMGDEAAAREHLHAALTEALAVPVPPEALNILVTLAYWQAKRGEPQHAAVRLGWVLRQPAFTHDENLFAERVQAFITAQLSPSAMTAALATPSAETLPEVAAAALAWLMAL